MSDKPYHSYDYSKLFRAPDQDGPHGERAAGFDSFDVADKTGTGWDRMKTEEYGAWRFALHAPAIKPGQSCQPLGAAYAGAGFADSPVSAQGAQICLSCYRSHSTRQFGQQPSTTKEAASSYGSNKLIDHSSPAADPATTGENGGASADFMLLCAQAPVFIGSHVTGYDHEMRAILQHVWDGQGGKEAARVRVANESINIIGGFDGYTVGNLREIKRILGLMDVDFTLLGDSGDIWGASTDGEAPRCNGGTTREQAASALHAKATLSMQEYCTELTLPYIAEHGQEVVALNHPVGVGATDGLLMTVSRITGKPIPRALERERGRLVDAIADSAAYLYGKSFAIYGDPDLCIGLTGFLLELGVEPKHILSTNGNKAWAQQVETMLAFSPMGQNGRVYPGRELAYMRSLLLSDPVDFLIGNTYGVELERDTGTPLVRIGFPIFDRHHHHCYPLWGYQGGLNVLARIHDAIFGDKDRFSSVPAMTDYSFDIIR